MKKVYLLKSEFEGQSIYKIGVTKNDVKKRVKQLQTGNGFEIEIVNFFESEYTNKIEKYLHNKYKLKNSHGEWFFLENKDVVNFLTECQEIHDNFKTLNDYGNPFI